LGLVVAASVLAGAFPAGAVPDRGELVRRAFQGVEARVPRTNAPGFAAEAGWPADAVPGALLVTTTAPDASRDLAARLWKSPELSFAQATASRLTAGVSRVRVAPGTEVAAAEALRAQPGVTAVEPVRTRTRLAVPDDPSYTDQWAHGITGIEEAWDITTGDTSVTVAVIDDGVVATHPDLVDNVVLQADATSGSVVEGPTGVDNDPCDEGHGTQVAGVIGAAGNNGTDVAGVNWSVSLLDIQVYGGEGGCESTTDDTVIAALDFAVTEGATVVNLSLGGAADACPTAYQVAIDNARENGVVVVAAAGNEEQVPELQGVTQVPASCNGVISVGAIGLSGDRAGYSTTNPSVDLAAPGGDVERDDLPGLILSTSQNGGVEPTQGTSFASPYVAGLAALVLAVNPDLTPDQVESVLEGTVADLGPAGRDNEYGWGLVQGGGAVQVAATDGDIPPPQPDPDFPVGGEGGSVDAPTPDVFRVSANLGATEAVTQAVAISNSLFEDQSAAHVLIARRDDYADALAGSALGYGIGPLLFASSTGPLPEPSRAELRRVLPQGGLVYLLGGPVALSADLENDLIGMGYQVRRLAGGAREETAVAVSRELGTRLTELGFDQPSVAIVATRGNWPDAVAVGSLAAYFGVPIFLTSPGELHPATAQALSEFAPGILYVVGGVNAISDPTAEAARQAAGTIPESAFRLAGPERNTTAVEVGQEFEFVLGQLEERGPGLVIAVNVRRDDGFTHVLSASSIAGAFGTPFVPVDGTSGENFLQEAQQYVFNFGVDGVIAGDVDLIVPETEDLLRRLLNGQT